MLQAGVNITRRNVNITRRNVETYEQKQNKTKQNKTKLYTATTKKYFRKQKDKEININFIKSEFNILNGVRTGTAAGVRLCTLRELKIRSVFRGVLRLTL